MAVADRQQDLYDSAMNDTQPEPDAAANDAFTVIERTRATPLIVLCDHARNALPAEYGTLGLTAADLGRHIAYDIGAEAVARVIAAKLGAPVVVSAYSRLLIDLNRGLDDPTLIMQLSDGAIVPGNRDLSEVERARRIKRYYAPYHAAIAGLIDKSLAGGIVPVLLSIHSFTPVFKGIARPWHASVLWGDDPRLARPLLEYLARGSGLVIGDNEPYEGVLEGDTLWLHGALRGLAHTILEVRQDLIATPQGQQDWGCRIAGCITAILADPVLAEPMGAIAAFGPHGQGVG